MSISWQARVLHRATRVITRLSARDLDKVLAKLQARGSTGGSVPKRLRGIDITSRVSHGMTVVRLVPTGASPERTVFYCHGGSYCYEAAGLHWSFLRRLALESASVFEVPLYPLAPVDTAGSTVPAVAAVMAEVAPSVVMGDSAGGGLALAVTQLARDTGGPLPKRLILIAPWLDVRTADPRQRAMEKGDIMLRVEALQMAGRAYTGDLALDHPFVAPVLGGLRGLPPLDVFVGTDDLLIVDTHELVRRGEEAGVSINVVEAARMQHVYPVLPLLPEARQGRAQIAELIRAT